MEVDDKSPRMADFQLLRQLPDELQQAVVERLDKQDLFSLGLASRWSRQLSLPLIWRDVDLVDCRRRYGPSPLEGVVDEHDDTPMLKKLLILAHNPSIASHVHTLTHRCHLPPPAIFHELPRTPFSGQTLSSDPRTAKLVQVAARHMIRLHTLRIIFGHPNVNDALLRTLFDANRSRTTPVRRLWLENCRISAGCDTRIVRHVLDLPLQLDFTGLQSIRFRRLPLRAGTGMREPVPSFQFNHARSFTTMELQNGLGEPYDTTINEMSSEEAAADGIVLSEDQTSRVLWTGVEDPGSIHDKLFELPHRFDEDIFNSIMAELSLPTEVRRLGDVNTARRRVLESRGRFLDPVITDPPEFAACECQREQRPSADVAITLLQSANATLTSLCLDWVFTMPLSCDLPTSVPSISQYKRWGRVFHDLFSLRFPHLRAFQMRNAVTSGNRIPSRLYLLDHSVLVYSDCAQGQNLEDNAHGFEIPSLRFMEAHPNLKCLAWPMDAFLSQKSSPLDIRQRVQDVIDNLSRTLVDLRVDFFYNGVGEPQSETHNTSDLGARERRRLFISEFASRMTKVESIKIEGGIPRDERREVIRALHACSLKKIVMIGITSPIGNTWGESGNDTDEPLSRDERDALEGEYKDAIHSLAFRKPEPPPPGFRFEPTYGWPPSPPVIHTLASFHADTITELKFCGYKGAPVLFHPTPITSPMLSGLKAFHKLETLIIGVWLSTQFEGGPRDAEIINFWLDSRDPESTALVLVTDDEPQGWERELRTKYAPGALAWQVTTVIGQHLSEEAKARKRGVHVRASVCIGECGGIYDLDLRIGKGSMKSDVCLSYKGPREELEPERRSGKLESRRWF